MTTSLRVTSSGWNFTDEGGGRTLSRGGRTNEVSFVVVRDKELGAAWLQWRQVARNKHKRKRERRRGCRGGMQSETRSGMKSVEEVVAGSR